MAGSAEPRTKRHDVWAFTVGTTGLRWTTRARVRLIAAFIGSTPHTPRYSRLRLVTLAARPEAVSRLPCGVVVRSCIPAERNRKPHPNEPGGASLNHSQAS